MNAKIIRRVVRRVQFASLVAKSPRQGSALYRLLARPDSVDTSSLDGVAQSKALDRLLRSSLIATGSVYPALKIGESLYLNGRIDEAFAFVRRFPGEAAELLDARLSLYNGDLDRATAISAAAIRRSSAPEAYGLAALCHYVRGDADKALDVLIPGAARHPKATFLMVLFSRIVRRREEVRRYLREKEGASEEGFSTHTAAQFVRACGRAGAVEEGEIAARSAAAELHGVRAATAPGAAGKAEKSRPKGGLRSGSQGDLVLKHVLEVGRNAQVTLFPLGGTLLGLVRDGALIVGDKDVDFGCFAEEASVPDLWRAFSASPYFVPTTVVENRLMKLRHLSGVTVDIFVHFRDGETRWHGGSFVCWEDPAFDLESLALGEQRFLVPNHPGAYLENHYGPSWRTRDSHFDVFWEAPNVRSVDKERRYLSTMARALQLLGAGATDAIRIRLERATNAKVDDVVAGFRFVLDAAREIRA